jgi:site-specific DNA-cytosine methylase
MGNGQTNCPIDTENTCPTLTCLHEAPIVTGPTIIDRAAFNQGVNAQYESRIEEGETMSPLVAKGPHGVAHAFKVRGGSSVETGEQGGKPGRVAGKGYLGQDECVFTIQATQDQMIAQPIPITICSNDANGTRKDRPNGGFYVTENPDVIGSLTLAENDTKVLQPIAVDWRTTQFDYGITQTLKTDLAKMSGPCIAVDCYNQTVNEHTSQTIGSSASDVNHYGAVLHSMAIRRLTPTECERLQGFPDSWTQIPYRNKSADLCPDGPRYKACGNSMAVPVMRWIGERINLVENLLNQNK